MGKYSGNTIQASATNHHVADGQSAVLNLSSNEENVTCEILENESCCSSLRAEEIIDSDEEDNAKLE